MLSVTVALLLAATPAPPAARAALDAVPDATRVARPVARPVAPAAERKTIAVLYFDNNTGDRDYDALGRGMASMMITDLAVVQDITVVEREKMQELLSELERQNSKYFDPSTAVKAGRMTGAQYIVTGSFAAVQPRIRIDTRVIRVETGEIVKTAQVTGKGDDFFDLQQRLARKLIDDLDVALSPEAQEKLRQRQEKTRLDNVNSMVAYSKAIDLLDDGDVIGAGEKITPVVRSNPNSMLVQLAYADIKRRSQTKAKNEAKERLKGGFRDILRGKP